MLRFFFVCDLSFEIGRLQFVVLNWSFKIYQSELFSSIETEPLSFMYDFQTNV